MPGGSFFVQQSAFATRPASGRRCRTPELTGTTEFRLASHLQTGLGRTRYTRGGRDSCAAEIGRRLPVGLVPAESFVPGSSFFVRSWSFVLGPLKKRATLQCGPWTRDQRRTTH